MKYLRNFFKIKSMQWQLIFRILLLFIFLLSIMELAQYMIMKQYFYKSNEQLLESRYNIVETTIKNNINSEQAVKDFANYLIDNTIDKNISTAIIDKDGNFVSESSSPESSRPETFISELFTPEYSEEEDNISVPHLSQSYYIKLLNQSGNLEGNRLIRDLYGNQIQVIWRKLGSDDLCYGLIQLSTSTDMVQDILYTQFYVYIISFVIILILGGMLANGILKYTLKPLHNMTNTVKQINVGQLDKRLPENNGQSEVDELSSSFNSMLERINVSFEKEQSLKVKMRQFVSDASHELRTPLTSIHGFVEVLLLGAAKSENQLNSALNSILIESDRLIKLVNDLLLITRLDQQAPLTMEEESLDKIIEEVYPQLQIISGERKLELKLKKDITVLVNRDQIKQVIYNLTHNAILHTEPKYGVISISLNCEIRKNETYAVLKVTDNGTGIPKNDITEVFNRFFRSESHRSRKQGGYGLGLSIVKSIIDAHNGEISVDSRLGKGTTFTIYLKLC